MKNIFFNYTKRVLFHLILLLIPWVFVSKNKTFIGQEEDLIIESADRAVAETYVNNPKFYDNFDKYSVYRVYKVKEYSYTNDYIPFSKKNVKHLKTFYKVKE